VDSGQKRSIEIVSFALGPAMTNAYLVGDPATDEAIVIDPAWQGEVILKSAEEHSWTIKQIWLTHAHFDHFGGAAAVANGLQAQVPVALHPSDHTLWRMSGGAAMFGFQSMDPGPEPTIDLDHGMQLQLGEIEFAVRHTPGHTQGHVIFVVKDTGTVFCGDLVFQGSVGRTDLPGGDTDTLLNSIRQEILTLPDEYRLLSGHGPETTVGQERRGNPFLINL
jgi:glyoxylase-like metal-dependent hydrolase (beta-lactamase superfamily II)